MARIIITLEIKGDEGEAMAAVDAALDAGVLQNFINEHPDYEAEVKSALATYGED